MSYVYSVEFSEILYYIKLFSNFQCLRYIVSSFTQLDVCVELKTEIIHPIYRVAYIGMQLAFLSIYA